MSAGLTAILTLILFHTLSLKHVYVTGEVWYLVFNRLPQHTSWAQAKYERFVVKCVKKFVAKLSFIFMSSAVLIITACINPLNPELIPICYLLALLGAHHFLHVSRIRVKSLTFGLLMSYIYIWSTHS